jgi:ribosomal protein S18 acetylase RimI-like enzyme
VEVSLREATLGDVGGLCRCYDELDALHREALPGLFRAAEGPARSDEFFSRILTDENAALLVADSGSQIVGFVIVSVRETPDLSILVPRCYASIVDLEVRCEFRRRGVGRALMERAEAWARERGAGQVELNVFEFNQEAIAFYEAMGYRPVVRRMWRTL